MDITYESSSRERQRYLSHIHPLLILSYQSRYSNIFHLSLRSPPQEGTQSSILPIKTTDLVPSEWIGSISRTCPFMLARRMRTSEVRIFNALAVVLTARNAPVIGPATATFVPHPRTKSGSTNLPEGVVHVYRDCDERPVADKLTSRPSATDVNVEDDGVTLGVLAVPAWMTPSDFLAFVEPAAEGMAHLRLVRSVSLPLYYFRLRTTIFLQGLYAQSFDGSHKISTVGSRHGIC